MYVPKRYAIFDGYTAAQADGIANGVETYLEAYEERREEVFDMYTKYINDLMGEN